MWAPMWQWAATQGRPYPRGDGVVILSEVPSGTPVRRTQGRRICFTEEKQTLRVAQGDIYRSRQVSSSFRARAITARTRRSISRSTSGGRYRATTSWKRCAALSSRRRSA